MLVTSPRRITVTEEVTTFSSFGNLLAWIPAQKSASAILLQSLYPLWRKEGMAWLLVKADCEVPILISTSAIGTMLKVKLLTELGALFHVVTSLITGGVLKDLQDDLEMG